MTRSVPLNAVSPGSESSWADITDGWAIRDASDGAERAAVCGGRRRPGEQPHALEERDAVRAGRALHALPVLEHLAQAVAIQLDPLAAHAHEPIGGVEEPTHLGRRQLLVAEGDGHGEIQKRVGPEAARPRVA